MKPRDCWLWDSSCVACKYRCFLRILIYIWWCDPECWLIYKNKRIKYEKASYIFSRDSKEVTWSSVTWERSRRSTKSSWALNVFLWLRASSPYGGVARCHARAARERRRQCEGREKKGRALLFLRPSRLPGSLARSLVLSLLASFAIIGDLARRLRFSSTLKRERFVSR